MAEIFPIIPGTARAGWMWAFVALLVLVMVLVVVLLFRSLQGMRNTTFTVSDEGLRIQGDVYGRLIPLGAIRVDEARAVNLQTETALGAKFRMMGTGLPSYQAGWFRLRDGQKALMYVTDPRSVAYVPTTEGYSVILSTPDPKALVAALQRKANGTQ